MTRLQKYNQIIWALVGTAALLGGLLLLGLFLYYEVSRSQPPQHEIIDEQQLAADRDAGIRRQKATFTPSNYHLTDAKKWLWSPIEVGVKTLERPEKLQEQKIRMSNISMRKPYSVADVTNLILWNRETAESRLLFEQRVQISSIIYNGENELDHILFVARPTDERGKKLYYYSVATNTMHEIDTGEYLVHEFARSVPANDGDITLVSLAIDENGNGEFDRKQEITIPFRFDPASQTVQPLAPDTILLRAQEILDGKITP